MAENGNAVLRFDYEADGDSEGVLSDINLDSWHDDIVDAANFVQEQCKVGSVNLYGLRLGGSLAWLAANSLNIDNVLLWDPIIDGKEYFNQLLRFNLTAQLSTYGGVQKERNELLKLIESGDKVNILGYEIHKSLADSLYSTTLNDTNRPDCHISIICSSPSSNPKPSKELSVLLNETDIPCTMIKSRPFWNEPRLIDNQQSAMVESSIALMYESTKSSEAIQV